MILHTAWSTYTLKTSQGPHTGIPAAVIAGPPSQLVTLGTLIVIISYRGRLAFDNRELNTSAIFSKIISEVLCNRLQYAYLREPIFILDPEDSHYKCTRRNRPS